MRAFLRKVKPAAPTALTALLMAAVLLIAAPARSADELGILAAIEANPAVMADILEGADRDRADALALAVEEDPAAVRELGRRFRDGDGVGPDDRAALLLFRLAGFHDDAIAQDEAILLMQNGRGLGVAEEDGKDMVLKMAESGDMLAQAAAPRIVNPALEGYVNWNIADGPPELLTVNIRENARWLLLSARQGCYPAMAELAVYFMHDDPQKEMDLGLEPGEVKRLLVRAAAHGYPMAQGLVGTYYMLGLLGGGGEDLEQADYWWRKAAAQGDVTSYGSLFSVYYMRGENFDECLEWAEKMAESGSPEGEYYLGICYHDGLAVSKDLEKAYEWTMKAAAQGLPKAQTNAGMCYLKGLGVEPDRVEAFGWLTKAAGNGQRPALDAAFPLFLDMAGTGADLAAMRGLLAKALEDWDGRFADVAGAGDGAEDAEYAEDAEDAEGVEDGEGVDAAAGGE